MTEQAIELPKAPALPRLSKKTLGGIAAGVLALGAGAFWLDARHYEDTDDAQVDGNISNLSPRVAGTVKAVYVADNQQVAAGDLLAELDPADLEIAAAQARAAVAQAEGAVRAEEPSVPATETSNQTALASGASELASAEASLAEARGSVAQSAALVAQAEAHDRTAQLERTRAERLIQTNVIPQSTYDERINGAIASTANLEALRHALEASRQRARAQEARVAVARSRLGEVRSNSPRALQIRKAALATKQASLELARAQLAQAELNLSYSRIVTPVAGIVGRKSINVGDRVAPGQQILAVSQNAGLWITANFRETQLGRMKPGQPAQVDVDALGLTLRGTVESIGGATGSRFSVLPPENATGNYVKVVQRIPVRIRLDDGQPGIDRLRPGLSVEPRVRIR